MTPLSSGLQAALVRLICAAGALASGSASSASLVAGQAPGGTLGAAAVSAVYDLPVDPGFTFSLDRDAQVWEYFHVSASAEINRIRWYGSDSDGAFGVALFGANCISCNLGAMGTDGNSPVNLLTHNVAFGPGEVSNVSLGQGLYAYEIALESPVMLDASTPFYGLTVVNNYRALPFQWASSAFGDGRHVDYTIGNMRVLNAPGDLAFALVDTRVAPVPEPAAYALWLGGAGLLLPWMSRRRRSGPGAGSDSARRG